MSTLAKKWQEMHLPLMLLGIMWTSELVDTLLFRGTLDRLGIRPREWSGLWGLLFAPFLHGGFAHLMANSLPFLILGWLVASRGVAVFTACTSTVMVLGGLGVWVFAPAHTVHIGASGLVFGYFGFCLARGFFERRPLAILISLVVGIAFGGLLWGVLPTQPGVSWQSHLFGCAAGVVAARRIPVKQVRPRKP